MAEAQPKKQQTLGHRKKMDIKNQILRAREPDLLKGYIEILQGEKKSDYLDDASTLLLLTQNNLNIRELIAENMKGLKSFDGLTTLQEQITEEELIERIKENSKNEYQRALTNIFKEDKSIPKYQKTKDSKRNNKFVNNTKISAISLSPQKKYQQQQQLQYIQNVNEQSKRLLSQLKLASESQSPLSTTQQINQLNQNQSHIKYQPHGSQMSNFNGSQMPQNQESSTFSESYNQSQNLKLTNQATLSGSLMGPKPIGSQQQRYSGIELPNQSNKAVDLSYINKGSGLRLNDPSDVNLIPNHIVSAQNKTQIDLSKEVRNSQKDIQKFQDNVNNILRESQQFSNPELELKHKASSLGGAGDLTKLADDTAKQNSIQAMEGNTVISQSEIADVVAEIDLVKLPKNMSAHQQHLEMQKIGGTDSGGKAIFQSGKDMQNKNSTNSIDSMATQFHNNLFKMQQSLRELMFDDSSSKQYMYNLDSSSKILQNQISSKDYIETNNIYQQLTSDQERQSKLTNKQILHIQENTITQADRKNSLDPMRQTEYLAQGDIQNTQGTNQGTTETLEDTQNNNAQQIVQGPNNITVTRQGQQQQQENAQGAMENSILSKDESRVFIKQGDIMDDQVNQQRFIDGQYIGVSEADSHEEQDDFDQEMDKIVNKINSELKQRGVDDIKDPVEEDEKRKQKYLSNQLHFQTSHLSHNAKVRARKPAYTKRLQEFDINKSTLNILQDQKSQKLLIGKHGILNNNNSSLSNSISVKHANMSSIKQLNTLSNNQINVSNLATHQALHQNQDIISQMQGFNSSQKIIQPTLSIPQDQFQVIQGANPASSQQNVMIPVILQQGSDLMQSQGTLLQVQPNNSQMIYESAQNINLINNHLPTMQSPTQAIYDKDFQSYVDQNTTDKQEESVKSTVIMGGQTTGDKHQTPILAEQTNLENPQSNLNSASKKKQGKPQINQQQVKQIIMTLDYGLVGGQSSNNNVVQIIDTNQQQALTQSQVSPRQQVMSKLVKEGQLSTSESKDGSQKQKQIFLSKSPNIKDSQGIHEPPITTDVKQSMESQNIIKQQININEDEENFQSHHTLHKTQSLQKLTEDEKQKMLHFGQSKNSHKNSKSIINLQLNNELDVQSAYKKGLDLPIKISNTQSKEDLISKSPIKHVTIQDNKTPGYNQNPKNIKNLNQNQSSIEKDGTPSQFTYNYKEYSINTSKLSKGPNQGQFKGSKLEQKFNKIFLGKQMQTTDDRANNAQSSIKESLMSSIQPQSPIGNITQNSPTNVIQSSKQQDSVEPKQENMSTLNKTSITWDEDGKPTKNKNGKSSQNRGNSAMDLQEGGNVDQIHIVASNQQQDNGKANENKQQLHINNQEFDFNRLNLKSSEKKAHASGLNKALPSHPVKKNTEQLQQSYIDVLENKIQQLQSPKREVILTNLKSSQLSKEELRANDRSEPAILDTDSIARQQTIMHDSAEHFTPIKTKEFMKQGDYNLDFPASIMNQWPKVNNSRQSLNKEASTKNILQKIGKTPSQRNQMQQQLMNSSNFWSPLNISSYSKRDKILQPQEILAIIQEYQNKESIMRTNPQSFNELQNKVSEYVGEYGKIGGVVVKGQNKKGKKNLLVQQKAGINDSQKMIQSQVMTESVMGSQHGEQSGLRMISQQSQLHGINAPATNQQFLQTQQSASLPNQGAHPNDQQYIQVAIPSNTELNLIQISEQILQMHNNVLSQHQLQVQKEQLESQNKKVSSLTKNDDYNPGQTGAFKKKSVITIPQTKQNLPLTNSDQYLFQSNHNFSQKRDSRVEGSTTEHDKSLNTLANKNKYGATSGQGHNQDIVSKLGNLNQKSELSLNPQSMGVTGKSPSKIAENQEEPVQLPDSLGQTQMPSQQDLNDRSPQNQYVINPMQNQTTLNQTTRSPHPMNLQDNTGTLKTTIISSQDDHIDSGLLSRTQSKIDAKFSLKKQLKGNANIQNAKKSGKQSDGSASKEKYSQNAAKNIIKQAKNEVYSHQLTPTQIQQFELQKQQQIIQKQINNLQQQQQIQQQTFLLQNVPHGLKILHSQNTSGRVSREGKKSPPQQMSQFVTLEDYLDPSTVAKQNAKNQGSQLVNSNTAKQIGGIGQGYPQIQGANSMLVKGSPMNAHGTGGSQMFLSPYMAKAKQVSQGPFGRNGRNNQIQMTVREKKSKQFNTFMSKMKDRIKKKVEDHNDILMREQQNILNKSIEQNPDDEKYDTISGLQQSQYRLAMPNISQKSDFQQQTDQSEKKLNEEINQTKSQTLTRPSNDKISSRNVIKKEQSNLHQQQIQIQQKQLLIEQDSSNNFNSAVKRNSQLSNQQIATAAKRGSSMSQMSNQKLEELKIHFQDNKYLFQKPHIKIQTSQNPNSMASNKGAASNANSTVRDTFRKQSDSKIPGPLKVTQLDLTYNSQGFAESILPTDTPSKDSIMLPQHLNSVNKFSKNFDKLPKNAKNQLNQLMKIEMNETARNMVGHSSELMTSKINIQNKPQLVGQQHVQHLSATQSIIKDDEGSTILPQIENVGRQTLPDKISLSPLRKYSTVIDNQYKYTKKKKDSSTYGMNNFTFTQSQHTIAQQIQLMRMQHQRDEERKQRFKDMKQGKIQQI